MARHAAPPPPRRTLLRAGLTLTAGAAALGVGGGAAQAAPAPLSVSDTPVVDLPVAGQAVGTALGYSTAGALHPVKTLKLNPLAGTGTDPLDNSLGTQIADFKPISTTIVTDPLTSGGALKDLPLVGGVVGLLPG